jgi:hypothetical protein
MVVYSLYEVNVRVDMQRQGREQRQTVIGVAGRLITRILAAATEPWRALSVRFRRLAERLERFLWEVDSKEEVYVELLLLYNLVGYYSEKIFKGSPCTLLGCLTSRRLLQRMQAACTIAECRAAACAEVCSEILCRQRFNHA